MKTERADQIIKRVLNQEVEIPRQTLERTREAYRGLGTEGFQFNDERQSRAGAEASEEITEQEDKWKAEKGKIRKAKTEQINAGPVKTGQINAKQVNAKQMNAGHVNAKKSRGLPGKGHKGSLRTKILLVAVFTVLVGGTVYALQSSWFVNRAQNMEEAYRMLDEAAENGNLSEEHLKILEQQKERIGQEAQRFQNMAEASDKEQTTFDLAELVGNSVVKEESYYDGSDFALVVGLNSIQYPVEYDFGPESEYFDQLWTYENGGPQETIDDLLGQYISSGCMTEQEFAKLKEIYETRGTVGFICYSVGIGDHVLMADGSDLTSNSGEDGNGRYLIQPYEGMPEKACNLDALDVVLKVKKFQTYVYVDEQGTLYTYCPVVEPELVTITLKNTTRE
ncbi:MAG: hypothetical protein PHE06_05720 [Lachnospiraceae bacterium]|nr:hypothetical protein [Lachnospiraceae bacterium]